MDLTIYFVSALIITPVSERWVQYTRSYSTKESCQTHMYTHKPHIVDSLIKYMKRDFEIKDFKCLTYREAVKLNSKLGH